MKKNEQVFNHFIYMDNFSMTNKTITNNITPQKPVTIIAQNDTNPYRYFTIIPRRVQRNLQ